MARNEEKPKSLRKPLRVLPNNKLTNSQINSHNGVSGGGGFSKSTIAAKKSISKKELANQRMAAREGEEDEEYLDRLLLVQSDLSSLTRQIDELVAQAFKTKPASKEGRKEIESFSKYLSDMLSSLKPWVPRFQKVFSCPSSENKNHWAQSLTDKNVSTVNEDESFEVQSPEHCTMNSLISPSPLVSWRAEGNFGRGRQLFLLTPLSLSKTKTLSFRRRNLSKSVSERVVSNPTEEVPSFLAVSSDANDDLLEGIAIKPTPNKPSASVVTNSKTKGDSENDQSMLVMTPCLKMSPPKSIMLLEPVSELSHKGNLIARKSTPFPVRLYSQDSESSSGSGDSDDLGLKYPELLGIQCTYKSRMDNKDLEASPTLFFSPLKTCVLLEPSDENSQDECATDDQLPIRVPDLNLKKETNLSEEFNNQGIPHQTEKPSNKETIHNSTLIESTPMWKEPESSMRTGKRPGETTLKRELWTKFEAASTYAAHSNVSAFPRTAQKGFLDMLDEVSLDEETR